MVSKENEGKLVDLAEHEYLLYKCCDCPVKAMYGFEYVDGDGNVVKEFLCHNHAAKRGLI